MKIKDKQELLKKLKKGCSICFDCAKDNGDKPEPPMAVTCWSGTCSVCGEEKSCCAITDWHWPKELFIDHVFD